jgi:hypothetical protein
MRHFKHPATIISTVALFAALSGGAIAGTVISGTQIKNHSIPAKKLTRSAVHQLSGRRGPQGRAGAQGPAGISTITDVSKSIAICSTGTACAVVSVTATCPSGSYVVGGAANSGVLETHISTFAGSVTYKAVADNASTSSGTVTVTAICAAGQGLKHAAAKM